MKYTFAQFRADFPNDDACLDKVLEMRYGGDRFDCPRCKMDNKFHRITGRRAYACQSCGHHVYPCVGTPFEKSRTPLKHWFLAMYFFTSSRHGVAAKELERQIGCTYKTAWRMAHELRKLMAQADFHGPLVGHIEVDETLIGGRQTVKEREEKGTNKTIVMGLVERDGMLRAEPVPDTKQATLEPIVLTNVIRGSAISTDENLAYGDLRNSGFHHVAVNHSAKEYVRGPYHTNTLEGFWAQLKRGIRGTHVHVSPKHLWKYVSEFSYRFNLRSQPEMMFTFLVWGLSRPRLKAG